MYLAIDSLSHPLVDCPDDFQTAMQQASGYIKTLSSGRSVPSPATSPSLSTALPSASDDVDKIRIDAMKRLTTVLQRNLRVRYELNVAQVVQAYVRLPSALSLWPVTSF